MLEAGFYLKAVFWLGIVVLTKLSQSIFKQSRISPLIPHIYVLAGLFRNFFGDFWVYLEFFSKD